jgi:pyruvate/2-oxoglutarate dehydrogenase complex dihydrolipoamide acyltransferase (E2) component
MPVLSSPSEAGVVERVYRCEGHQVDEGDRLFEVRVGHYALTIHSPRDGTISQISVRVGDRVIPGDFLAEVSGILESSCPVIFIAYRRADSQGAAGRLYDSLIARFGSWPVFIDVGSLAPGTEFRREIESVLRYIKVMIVVIGPRWSDASDPSGARKLDKPEDLHRTEIRAVLNRGIPVIPVLVDGAPMPRPEELPGDIARLVHYQGVTLSHESWPHDIEKLGAAVSRHLASTTEPTSDE